MREGQDGVFERLPKRRPTLHTPRRDRRRPDLPSDEEKGEGRRVDFEADEPERARSAAEEHYEAGPRRRVEDLTLSGIGAAADVVVLGLKLIERAYGGVRRGVDRH